ncbi:hypothetical protein HZA55_07290 [Candidatus Poribacteria bacterium]|nr:hypothetical protein [Candidatus Poribacteria bacterium]
MTSPLGIEFFCNSIMPDGGKICRSNLDCVSDTCIVNEGDNVAKCALYKASYGCYIKLITSRGFSKDQARKGEIIREQLCVD